MKEYLLETLESLKNLSVPASQTDFFNMLTTPLALVVAGLLVVFAFEGYKVFKAALYIGSAVALGIVGDVFLAPLVPESFVEMLPPNITLDVHGAVAVVCAIAGVLLTRLSIKFMVFVMGGVAGYLVGSLYVVELVRNYFTTLGFLRHNFVAIAFGAACALVASIFFILLFKYVYIIGSGLGGMAAAALIVGKTVMPEEGDLVMFCYIALGVVIGIFAAAHQFIEERKNYEIDF